LGYVGVFRRGLDEYHTAHIASLALALAYDVANGLVVLFGGFSYEPVGVYSDTYEYDGTSWAYRATVVAPQARSAHAMTYDLVRDVIVLFAGSHGWADTWELDGSDWLETTPPDSPPARRMHTLVYDEWRDRHVLFGGYSTAPLGDTWEYF
jgi:hypothetical protein